MKRSILILAVISLFSCEKETTKSDQAEIISFTATATGDFSPYLVQIDNENNQVIVFANSDPDDIVFPVVLIPDIQISEGASISPASGTTIAFDDDEDFIHFSVTAEDGEHSEDWILGVRGNQIPNSEFEFWHEETGMNGLVFSEPGRYEESIIWATANMGTSIYSAYGTSAIVESENTLVQIETINTMAVPVASGTLFLGRFDVDGAIANPTNPSAATKFGIPFCFKPAAIKFKYKYQSGEQLIQATLNDPENLFGGFTIEDLTGSDAYSVFAVLEKRVGEEITVIGEMAVEGSETVDMLTEMTVPIDYYSDEMPTHFYIAFASSTDGDLYRGAVGSTLIIDDLELVYE
jgi:hypothetical protein